MWHTAQAICTDGPRRFIYPIAYLTNVHKSSAKYSLTFVYFGWYTNVYPYMYIFVNIHNIMKNNCIRRIHIPVLYNREKHATWPFHHFRLGRARYILPDILRTLPTLLGSLDATVEHAILIHANKHSYLYIYTRVIIYIYRCVNSQFWVKYLK